LIIILEEIYDFISFDPSKPDIRAFEIPEDISVICKDFTDSNVDSDADIASVSPDTLVNDEISIAKINAKAKSWKAGPNKVFDGMTHAQFSKQFISSPRSKYSGGVNALRSTKSKPVAPDTSNRKISIPESFDASKQWPYCGIDTIRFQGQCSACWAFGSTEVLGDRYCIAYNGTYPLLLSPQYPVSCYYDVYGCEGGFVEDVWNGLVERGTVEERCFTYSATERMCPMACDDGSMLQLYRARDAYPIYTYNNLKDTMEKIQREIMTYGPVDTAFFVFNDFPNYKSGVYQRTPGSRLGGGHHVKIYGWGVDDYTGLPYWLVANSWGENWGEHGTFRILRGTNECNIEDNIGAGRAL